MTLDEAIEHSINESLECGPCADDHKQLAEWLIELRYRRESKRNKISNKRLFTYEEASKIEYQSEYYRRMEQIVLVKNSEDSL